jgi:hypothetical protein
MKRVGLYPSDTGKPGGRETGQQMTHYILAGGPFEKACQEILNQGYSLDYFDRLHDPQKTPVEKNKVKYSCNTCAANTWGKPKSDFVCGACLRKVLHEVGETGEVIEAIIKIAGMTSQG